MSPPQRVLAPEVPGGLSSGPSVSRQLDFRAEPTSSPPGFRLVGEVDLSNASQLGELLLGAVQAGGDVTLDLSEVAFIDSTGIQVLLKAVKRIEGRGRIVLYHPGTLVLNVLKLIKADLMPGLQIVEEEP
jgi:anti-anti-sigma factor